MLVLSVSCISAADNIPHRSQYRTTHTYKHSDNRSDEATYAKCSKLSSSFGSSEMKK